MRGALLSIALLATLACGPGAVQRPDVLLATTTSFQDSGLLDVLKADFEARSGHRLRPTAVGTGAALAIGARGDADVLVVHAPEEERSFMANGNGELRLLVMHNDFVIAGPASDPAGIRGMRTSDALKKVAAAQATFVSRADNSGTDLFEKRLWRDAGIAPAGRWYIQAATGMGQTLQVASEKRAYTLTDRATFLARRSAVDLAIIVERAPPLINPYHVITVHPKKFPRVNAAGARAFAMYLVSPDAQRLIGAYGAERYGEPLFVPDAGKDERGLL